MKYGFDGDKLERVICDLLGLDPPSVPAASKMTKLMLPHRNVINLKKTTFSWDWHNPVQKKYRRYKNKYNKVQKKVQQVRYRYQKSTKRYKKREM